MLHTEKKSKTALQYLSQEQLYRALDRSKQFRGYSSYNRDDVYDELRRRSTHDVDYRYVEQPRRKPSVVEPKCKYPRFQGGSGPEVYYAWEEKIDRLFEDYQFSEIEIVQGATTRFSGYALLWWKELVRSRRDNREPKVNTWDELKRIMRKQFVPSFKSWQTLVEINGWRDEKTNVTSSSTQKDNVSGPTCLKVTSLESSSSPPPQENTPELEGTHDSLHTSSISADDDVKEESSSKEEESDSEPINQEDNVSDPLGEVVSSLVTFSSPPHKESKCAFNPSFYSSQTSSPLKQLYFDDKICKRDMGCELQKTKSKEAKSEKSQINGTNLVGENIYEVKVTQSPKEKDKKKNKMSDFPMTNHNKCSSSIVLFFQDFVEPLRGAQLDHSTYDKEAFLVDVDDRSLRVSLDSRTNLFEEWGNDTCMGWPKSCIFDNMLKLFDKSEKSVNFGRNFGWDPGIFRTSCLFQSDPARRHLSNAF